MNSTVLSFVIVAGIIAVIVFSGFVLDKLMKKAARKKYKHEFSLMCYAVAKEICAQTKCNLDNLRFHIKSFIDMCAEYQDLPREAGLKEYYKLKDYRHFTYLCALYYVKQYKRDDYERESVEEHCLFELPDFSKMYFDFSYNDRDDINHVPKNSGYLVVLFVWIIIVWPIIKTIFFESGD